MELPNMILCRQSFPREALPSPDELEYVALSPAAFCACGPDARLEKIGEIGWQFDNAGRIIPWGKE